MPLENPGSGGSWITPTLGSIWQAYGTPFDTPGYRRNSQSVVYLRGWIKWIGGANVAIFTLPPSYRPTALKRYLVSSANASNVLNISVIEIQSDGAVWWRLYGPYEYLSFDSISFATY